MPQLDKYIFVSQYFWLFLFFFISYFILVKWVIPSIFSTFKFRKLKVTNLSSTADLVSSVVKPKAQALSSYFVGLNGSVSSGLGNTLFEYNSLERLGLNFIRRLASNPSAANLLFFISNKRGLPLYIITGSGARLSLAQVLSLLLLSYRAISSALPLQLYLYGVKRTPLFSYLTTYYSLDKLTLSGEFPLSVSDFLNSQRPLLLRLSGLVRLVSVAPLMVILNKFYLDLFVFINSISDPVPSAVLPPLRLLVSPALNSTVSAYSVLSGLPAIASKL